MAHAARQPGHRARRRRQGFFRRLGSRPARYRDCGLCRRRVGRDVRKTEGRAAFTAARLLKGLTMSLLLPLLLATAPLSEPPAPTDTGAAVDWDKEFGVVRKERDPVTC